MTIWLEKSAATLEFLRLRNLERAVFLLC